MHAHTPTLESVIPILSLQCHMEKMATKEALVQVGVHSRVVRFDDNQALLNYSNIRAAFSDVSQVGAPNTNAPINVMPQYPLYGQNTGHIRGTDEKSVPHTGDFDIQVYAHTHMK